MNYGYILPVYVNVYNHSTWVYNPGAQELHCHLQAQAV